MSAGSDEPQTGRWTIGGRTSARFSNSRCAALRRPRCAAGALRLQSRAAGAACRFRPRNCSRCRCREHHPPRPWALFSARERAAPAAEEGRYVVVGLDRPNRRRPSDGEIGALDHREVAVINARWRRRPPGCTPAAAPPAAFSNLPNGRAGLGRSVGPRHAGRLSTAATGDRSDAGTSWRSCESASRLLSIDQRRISGSEAVVTLFDATAAAIVSTGPRTLTFTSSSKRNPATPPEDHPGARRRRVRFRPRCCSQWPGYLQQAG